jgi:hypothetical protein
VTPEERKLETLLAAQLKQDCAESESIGYAPRKFRAMMSESGPAGACVRVIMSAKIPDGFLTLLELNRLDLTAEATVLRGPWKELFESGVLDRARKRLKDYGRPDLAAD